MELTLLNYLCIIYSATDGIVERQHNTQYNKMKYNAMKMQCNEI